MAIMELKTCIFLAVNAFSVYYVISTAFNLGLFLSSNKNGLLFTINSPVYSEDAVVEKVVFNVALLCLFIFIHSFTASVILKHYANHLGLSVLYRSLYNIASCWCLKAMMGNWFVLLPNAPLFWNKSESDAFVLACQIFHLLGWFSVFSTVYILDFTEFLGTKQILYMMHDLGCPLSAKTLQAQNFFVNMRHPIVCGLLSILWIVPCMSIDRFILSSVSTIYLLYGSNLNAENYQYIKEMYTRKRYALRDVH